KDCGEKGHHTKRHRLCKRYISTSQQVGTGVKRKIFTEKRDSTRLNKQARRLADKKEAPIAKCSSCGTEGHNTSRPPLCPHRKSTKIQQADDLLGKHISVTRKIKLETILRPEYRGQLTNRIINMSSKLRDVMVRSQIFVSYYILCQNDQPVSNKIYTQNSWYSMAQLLFIKYDGHMDPGYSQCLSAACVEMATAYTNMVVECFESRVKNYLFYSVKILFEEVKYFYMQI
ncbi:hypothetical protein BDF14DRAFT_1735232, partial [Spinellus fusiger]